MNTLRRNINNGSRSPLNCYGKLNEPFAPSEVVIRRLGLSKDYPLSPSVPSSQETNAIAIRNVSSSSSISRLWISLFHRARKFTRIFILHANLLLLFFLLFIFFFFSLFLFFFFFTKDKSIARKLTCCAIPFFSLYLN